MSNSEEFKMVLFEHLPDGSLCGCQFFTNEMRWQIQKFHYHLVFVIIVTAKYFLEYNINIKMISS